MDYQLVRSNRRTVALVIGRQGKLVVRAPKKAPLEAIERFIGLKRVWIEKKMAEAAKYPAADKKFAPGEKYWFLGQQRPLRVIDDYRSRLGYENGEFIISRFQLDKARFLFQDWYRAEAQKLLPQRAAYFAPKMLVNYKKITVNGAATRWGSCSSRGTVNFSWRLVMVPLEVADYVVIHELAHLAHHNHSQKFWQFVAQFCPDFAVMKKWLNRQGKSLAW